MTVDKAKKDWALYVVGIALTLSASFFAIQWQQTEAEVNQLATQLEKLEAASEQDVIRMQANHDDDIARLDESNRNRRNQIADLEERIAIIEERTRP